MSRPFIMPRDPAILPRYLRLTARDEVAALRTRRVYRLFAARNGIFHSLRALGIEPGRSVLVPAYICASAVSPILAHGAAVKFYRVDETCNPDFDDLERKIEPECAAVLAVHYFGFPQSMGRFRTLCDRHGLRLIEDCAHVLYGSCDGAPLGSFGDVSVFSWRKFLPIFDGATLVLNSAGADFALPLNRHGLGYSARVVAGLFERSLQPYPALDHLLRAPIRMAGSVRGRLRPSTGASSTGLVVGGSGDEFDAATAALPMSPVSKAILRHSDLLAIGARRRKNFLHLSQALGSESNTRLLRHDLDADSVPWVCPILLNDGPGRLERMRRDGLPIVSWSGVRHHALPAGVFPEAERLYRDLLFLPVHQGLGQADLDSIVRAVARA